MLKRLACLLFGHKAEHIWNMSLDMEDRDRTWWSCALSLCPRCGVLHAAFRAGEEIPMPIPGWNVRLREPHNFDWAGAGYGHPGLNADSPGPESRPTITPEMVGPEPHA